MRRLRIVVAVASCSALVALSGGAVVAHSASATSGTLTITTNTTLTEDHYGTIVIGADNITLNCAGHHLYAPGSGAGVRLDNRTGVTVKNCVASGFNTGFSIVNANGNKLVGNTASGSTGFAGFLLSNASGNTLRDNTASGNLKEGLLSSRAQRRHR
jgi:parallel beta-helix repeat protein